MGPADEAAAHLSTPVGRYPQIVRISSGHMRRPLFLARYHCTLVTHTVSATARGAE